MKRIFLPLFLMLALVPAMLPQQPAAPVPVGNLFLQNASLREVVDQLARQLQLNIQMDDRLDGTVTLNTYGQPGQIDARNLLELILRINGFGLLQEGAITRIVPLNEMVRLPILRAEAGQIVEDDQTMLNLVFLKYVTVDEVSKILAEFTDERTIIRSYPPANLLFILDSRRSMRRLMDLIALFDSDTFAQQRVRLFEIQNSLPSELVKQLETVLRSISLDNQTSTVRFLPVDHINTLIAVAPNPGVFETIETWIRKLDIPITETSRIIDTYVYRVRYGRADCLAIALNQLYLPLYFGGGYGYGGYGGAFAGFNPYGGYGGGYSPYGGFGVGGAAPASGFPVGGLGSQYANPNSFGSGFGGSGACGPYAMGGMGGMGGGYGYGLPAFGGYAAQVPVGAPSTLMGGGGTVAAAPQAPGAAAAPGAPGGAVTTTAEAAPPPRIVPNPLDNSLLIQANQQQYQGILKLLRELDRPPRQILLEAKIYSVVMSGSFAAGVEARFQAATGVERRPLASLIGNAARFQAGTLVGQSRELLAFLNLQENRSNARIISEPSLIATDSIPASINVGTQVPVLTGQVNNLGAAAFTTQGISSHNTGVTLQVNARVNPSGVVTLMINQEVSAPVPTTTSNIQTPSFDQQVVQTQITLQDGDTIAIGGIISETNSQASAGIPLLHRIPYVGALFGSKNNSQNRTELILFMTPHVIYDTTDLVEASEELKLRMRKLRTFITE
jgi:general secretion pathway protein D